MTTERADEADEAADDASNVGEDVDDASYVDEDADRLTALALDVMGPSIAFWRNEVARRLDVDAPSLVCLELAARHGQVSPALIAERTGLTRSAVSKMLRRLRDAGQVDLIGGGERGRALEVVARPHAERDRELARLRQQVRNRVRWTALYGFDERERTTAIRLLRGLVDSVHGAAVQSADEAAEERRAAARLRSWEARAG